MTDVRARLAELTPSERERLLARLDSASGPSATRAPPVRGHHTRAPMSFAQERLWFLDRFEGAGSSYNLGVGFRLEGPLDLETLNRCLAELAARHESLRTAFVSSDGVTSQVIEPTIGLAVTVLDVSSAPAGERVLEARELVHEHLRRPFDLARPPLLRAIVVRLGHDDHILALIMHHIISDGWSLAVILRDLGAIYGSLVAGAASALTPLPVQYIDYTLWQREWIESGGVDRQLAHWRDRLAGLETIALPTDGQRRTTQMANAVRHDFALGDDRYERLLRFARTTGCTPYMALLAVFHTLLHRYSGQDDVTVGSPIAGRTYRQLDDVVGFFVNTLVLRGDTSGRLSFRALLARTRELALEAYANQDVPFQLLVNELRPRENTRNPLFQANLNVQAGPGQTLELAGIRVTDLPVECPGAQFDLALEVITRSGGAHGILTANRDLFEPATIERVAGHLRTLVDEVVGSPDQPLDSLRILPEGERRQVLVTWNDTAVADRAGPTVHGRIAALAQRTPDAVAISDADGPVTYGDLDAEANRVAHRLDRIGARETLVAVCLERSALLDIALLGILKAGSAYVPLDPGYPRERLDYMLRDSGATHVVTSEGLCDRLPSGSARRLLLDRSDLAGESDVTPERACEAGSVAYAMYTSGSTGRPKAVLGTHRGILNRVRWMERRFAWGPGDRCCQMTSSSFVDSVWEIFGPLLGGVPLVVAAPGLETEPARLVHFLRGESITRLVLVPALLRAVLDVLEASGDGLPALRVCVSSGEPLAPPLAQRALAALPGSRLLNLYGSSECAADISAHEVVAPVDADRPVPVGRPIDNTRIYVLDGGLEPVPIGVTGELYAAGAGLSHGYLGRPGLTAERFVPDPFGADGTRLYRTGDRGRVRSDGAIEVMGRSDGQVKVRGQRVELGEVETALLNQPGIAEAVVVGHEDSAGDTELTAFVVSREGETLDVDTLRRELGRGLPRFMVPAAFVSLGALPRGPSGKVDRRALPRPDRERTTLRPRIAPRTATEAVLAELWKRLLELDDIGVEDDFFDLGGHSLLSVRMLAEIERGLARELSLATMFEVPTIAEVAARLDREFPSPPWSSLVPIRSRGRHAPVFLVHGVDAKAGPITSLAECVPGDRPSYGIRASGRGLAGDCVETIRTLQPSGPYYLVGVAYAGTVAFEMARLLQAQGQSVAMLLLVDVPAPGYRRRLLEPLDIRRGARARYHGPVTLVWGARGDGRRTAGGEVTRWRRLAPGALEVFELPVEDWADPDGPVREQLVAIVAGCLSAGQAP